MDGSDASMVVIPCYAEWCLALRLQVRFVSVRSSVAGSGDVCMPLPRNCFRKHQCVRKCAKEKATTARSWKWPAVATGCLPPKRASPVGGGTLEHVIRTL